MNLELLQKANNYYNFQAELKRQNIIANKKWGQSDNPTVPPYKKAKIIRHNAGMINFFLQLRP